MRFPYYLLLVVLCFSCDTSEQSDEGLSESKTEAETIVEMDGYKPSANTKFIWDFSSPRTYVYSYSQVVENNNKEKGDPHYHKSNMSSKGNFIVRVTKDHLAELGFVDLVSEVVVYDDDGLPEDTVQNTSSPQVIQYMRADGSFTSSGEFSIFDMLIPIPGFDLKEGETDKVLISIPYNVNGLQIDVTGYNTLVFDRFEEVGGHKCAVLNGMIDVSTFDLPDELEGYYEISTTGNGTYYFNLDDHCLVGADLHMTMKTIAYSEVGERSGDQVIDMNKYSENTIELKLVEIKE